MERLHGAGQKPALCKMIYIINKIFINTLNKIHKREVYL